MRPYITIVIKPTLACNIDCRHCYHTPEDRVQGSISFDTLDRIFRMASEEYESVWFIWHGGEPLLLPFQFYRKAMDLQKKHFGEDAHRVGNTIQTNGLKIDRRYANFCRENQINLGVSYEGPFNDVLRERSSEVDDNLRYLSKKEHKFSVNSTISYETASKQLDLYRYFRERDINISFAPVIPSGCAACNRGLIPDADEYIRSSIETFDEWLFDKDTDIPLIPHYLYLLNAMGDPVESDCSHSSCMTKWICVYPDGDLYPCAKSCPKQYRLCNVSDISHLSDAFQTEGFKQILMGTIARREKCKAECELFEHCNGGCSVDACYENGIENNGGDSCRIFKAVYGHVSDVADGILNDKPNLDQYNKFVRDAVIGKLVNPKIANF